MITNELSQAVAVIADGNMTKQTIGAAADAIVSNVLDGGEIDPLLAYTQLKALQAVIDDAVKRLQESALNAAEKYEGKSFAAYGVDYQVKEVGVKYDFSGDETWQGLNDTLKGLQAEIKGRETQLKVAGWSAKSSSTQVCVNFCKQ